MDALSSSRPGAFCRQLLNALDASDGRTKRRKRDQTPDTIGLGMKRTILERAVEEDPPPEEFEAWLMRQVLAEPSSGGLRAMCAEILTDYRLAAVDSTFQQWLAAGAPSEDAAKRTLEPTSPKADEQPIEWVGPRRQDSRPCGCRFELFGTARLTAGVRWLVLDMVEPATVRSLLPALIERCPALAGAVVDLDRQAMAPGYVLNRNGRDFLTDADAMIYPGDDLLILSSAAGG